MNKHEGGLHSNRLFYADYITLKYVWRTSCIYLVHDFAVIYSQHCCCVCFTSHFTAIAISLSLSAQHESGSKSRESASSFGIDKLVRVFVAFQQQRREEAVGESSLLPPELAHWALPAPASCLSWVELMQGRAGVFLISIADFPRPFIIVIVTAQIKPLLPSASQPAFLKINRSPCTFRCTQTSLPP